MGRVLRGEGEEPEEAARKTDHIGWGGFGLRFR